MLSELMGGLPTSVVAAILVAFIILCILLSGYVKAKPDEALLISGLRKNRKPLIGKAGIKIPFFERVDKLKLQLIPVDVKTSSAVPTADYININVDAAVNVKISDKDDRLKLAAQNFLNKDTEYIGRVAREVLEGNMREIVGRMALEEMVSDRQKFAELVKENAEPDLAAMGLDIISFNVQNFVDGNGVIENLGVDNVVKIQKNAAISRANSEKEIAKAQASAKQEANEAEVAAEQDIAQRQNELEIKKAELKAEADNKKAIADASYRIQEEEQRQQIEVASVNANIARQEREIELKRKEVDAQEQILNAEVRKKAEADKYAITQQADADLYQRQKEAEAKKFEVEKEAEARKAQAEAEKYAKEQEADAIRAQGLAEADAIRARGLAEAEAIEKKADAMQKYGEAAKLEMVIKMLPEFADRISKNVASIKDVTVFDNGSGNGVASVGGWTPIMMEKVFAEFEAATGFSLKDVMAAQTLKAKTDRNVSVDGNPVVDVHETFSPEPRAIETSGYSAGAGETEAHTAESTEHPGLNQQL